MSKVFRAIHHLWMVFVVFGVPVACLGVTAVVILTYFRNPPTDPPTEYHYQCVYGCSAPPDIDFDRDGWFNPSYSHTYLDIARVMRDRWQIGNRTYRTKDLMGQRI